MDKNKCCFVYIFFTENDHKEILTSTNIDRIKIWYLYALG